MASGWRAIKRLVLVVVVIDLLLRVGRIEIVNRVVYTIAGSLLHHYVNCCIGKFYFNLWPSQHIALITITNIFIWFVSSTVIFALFVNYFKWFDCAIKQINIRFIYAKKRLETILLLWYFYWSLSEFKHTVKHVFKKKINSQTTLQNKIYPYKINQKQIQLQLISLLFNKQYPSSVIPLSLQSKHCPWF